MTNQETKKQVKEILQNFAKISKDKIPTKKDGNIDMERFYKMPEVVEITKKLKNINVNSKWLFKNGFVPAGMLLRIK